LQWRRTKQNPGEAGFCGLAFWKMGSYRPANKALTQGELFSPVLVNIYLHCVLRLRFEKRYAKTCQGKAHRLRYSDAFVACLEHEQDVKSFVAQLQQRQAVLRPEVEPCKTVPLRSITAMARALNLPFSYRRVLRDLQKLTGSQREPRYHENEHDQGKAEYHRGAHLLLPIMPISLK
jgi:hypothetical protein